MEAGNTVGSTTTYSSAQLERAKQQVEDVKGIMGQNVQRIIQRGEDIDNLGKRAENLTANASEFQRTSRTLKTKMWWQNLKMMLILGLIVVIVIIIIIVASVGIPSGGSGGSPPSTVVVVPPTGAESSDDVAKSITKRSVMEELYHEYQKANWKGV